MPTPALTAEEQLRRKDALDRHGGNITVAARELGVSRSALRHSVKRYELRVVGGSEGPVEFPSLSDPELDIEELKRRRREGFLRQHQARQSRQWMPFRFKKAEPILLAFFGDPHLDDNGCNWPLLERDVELVCETDGAWGIGLGDYTNNWSGRLTQLYKTQEATTPQAWRLAQWFFQAVPWLLLIKGNHDLWSAKHGNGDPLDWMQRGMAPLENWQAKFQLEWPDCAPLRVWAAHDFKGSSIYNPLHSNMRKSQRTGAADIYVTGDKHNWAAFQTEDAERAGDIYWAIRARGYKYVDEYADNLGYEPQEYGATVAAVIDPRKAGPDRVQCFADLPQACQFLRFLRAAA